MNTTPNTEPDFNEWVRPVLDATASLERQNPGAAVTVRVNSRTAGWIHRLFGVEYVEERRVNVAATRFEVDPDLGDYEFAVGPDQSERLGR